MSGRHDPTYLNTARHGSWCVCSCGWTSNAYIGQMGPQLEFAEHLRPREI